MIEEHALVREINGSDALVEVQRQSACGSCTLEKGCGTGSLGRLLGHKTSTYFIENNHNLKTGDHIVIGLSEAAYLKAGVLIYLTPLLSLFLTAFAADWMFNGSEIVNVVAALFGLSIGFWWVRRLSYGRYAHEFQAKFMRRELIE